MGGRTFHTDTGQDGVTSRTRKGNVGSEVRSDSARLASWLHQPLSGWWCFVGWCAATALFVAIVSLLGGIGAIDTYQSVFSTWAIAHGQLTCAFPQGFRVIPPVYPLLSGGIAAIGHIGSGVRFPSGSDLGTHCSHAFIAINAWSLKADVINRTTNIAYIAWPILMAGVIAILRAANCGRRRWEPMAVVIVALVPPVWLCIEGTFHPQDLIAMGLILASLASVLRDNWLVAGILIALAVLSQQFALLVAAPLLVLVPRNRAISYVGAAVGTTLVVTLPFLITNIHGAFHAIVFGTGNTGGIGGTVLWELNLHGAPLVLVSRILPIVLGLIVAVWALRHLGRRVLDPVPLLAIVGLSLSFRLLFEQQLFGYYFMALSVALIMLDVVQRQLRSSVAAWIAALSMVYLLDSDALQLLPHAALTFVRNAIPIALMVFAGALIIRDFRQRHLSWLLAAWVGMFIAALLTWDRTNLLGSPPSWFWQMAFVPLGIALAAAPLQRFVHHGSGRGPQVDRVTSVET